MQRAYVCICHNLGMVRCGAVSQSPSHNNKPITDGPMGGLTIRMGASASGVMSSTVRARQRKQALGKARMEPR